MENLERIEKFLNKQLSDEEQASFELEIEGNRDLKEEVASVLLLRDAIKAAEVRTEVQKVQQSFLQSRKPAGLQRSFGKKVWRIAAGVVFIGSVSAGFWFSQITGSSVLNDYELPYMAPVVRSTEAEQEEVRIAFQNGKYKALIKRMEEINEPTAEQDFLAAMASLELNDFGKARDFLKRVSVKDKDGLYRYEIPYYEGLAALGNKDYQTALARLSDVRRDRSNPYSKTIPGVMLLKIRYLLFINPDKVK